ncbi:hypothetical protein OG601_46070 [Streptomyces sp. NBC_01239]|uniref:hypothetical protein n=1 Tax=Streptomyces sp. NBC_01239 TaxID=2903792 RepID=UPI0022515DF4|nr:hypothetical protein [Streptomyces sp. NBC_01239]MCX4817957.1 hypothetical protein [Streptomyces sp. NBC_01239]
MGLGDVHIECVTTATGEYQVKLTESEHASLATLLGTGFDDEAGEATFAIDKV